MSNIGTVNYNERSHLRRQIEEENGLKDKGKKTRAAAEKHYIVVDLNLQPATGQGMPCPL
jgi:hypothetical protein